MHQSLSSYRRTSTWQGRKACGVSSTRWRGSTTCSASTTEMTDPYSSAWHRCLASCRSTTPSSWMSTVSGWGLAWPAVLGGEIEEGIWMSWAGCHGICGWNGLQTNSVLNKWIRCRHFKSGLICFLCFLKAGLGCVDLVNLGERGVDRRGWKTLRSRLVDHGMTG